MNSSDVRTDDRLSASDNRTLGRGERTSTVIGGARWQSTMQVASQAIRLGTTLVLARLLTPADFGIVAYALTIITFVDVFKHMGAIAAIIERPTISQRLLSSLFYMNVATGLVLGIAFALLSPVLVSSTGSDENPWVLAPMGLVIVVSSMGIVNRGLLRRRLAFRRVAIVNVTPTVIFGIVAIVLATRGAGASAIVTGQVCGAVGGVAIGWFLARWWPSLVFDLAEIKSVLGVVGYTMGFGIFNYMFENADKVMVGSVLGASALGVYSIGQRVLMYPVYSMTLNIGQVLFPTFARMGNDDRAIGRGFLRACAAIALVTFPMMIGVAVLAQQFVDVILGEKWQDAVFIITVLAPIGLLHAIHYTVGPIYQAKGRFRALMLWGIASGTATLAAYVAGLPWGINGVTLSYAIMMVILTYPTFAIPFHFIGLRFSALVRAVGPTLIAALAMGGIVLAFRLLMERRGADDAVILFGGTALGIVVYGAWIFVARPPSAAEFLRIVGMRGAAANWRDAPTRWSGRSRTQQVDGVAQCPDDLLDERLPLGPVQPDRGDADVDDGPGSAPDAEWGDEHSEQV